MVVEAVLAYLRAPGSAAAARSIAGLPARRGRARARSDAEVTQRLAGGLAARRVQFRARSAIIAPKCRNIRAEFRLHPVNSANAPTAWKTAMPPLERGAAEGPRPAQQFRFEREVDDLRHPMRRAEQFRGSGGLTSPCRRRAVHYPSASAMAPGRSMPAAARPSPNWGAGKRRPFPPRRVGVEHRELPDAETEQRMRHGRTGAARAHLHHPVALGSWRPRLKPSRSPTGPCLCPTRLPSRSTRVHGAQGPRAVRSSCSSGITAACRDG